MSAIAELLALCQRAEALLASVPELDGHRARCHVAVLRTHIDCTSYTLFADRASGGAMALIRSWQRQVDEARFGDDWASTDYPVNVQPTMESWQVPVSPGAVHSVMLRAQELRVPASLADLQGGQDGTVYVLSFIESTLASATFRWWQASWMDDAGLTREGPSPAGWHELPDLARRVINLAGGPVWPGPWTRWQGPPG